VGERTARVLLLTDSNSRIPVTIQPSGQRALLMGDNTAGADPRFHRGARGRAPRRPGRDLGRWRGVSGGPGGRRGGRDDRRAAARRLAADYARLQFLRVMRSHPGIEAIPALIGRPGPSEEATRMRGPMRNRSAIAPR
jgi:rod shape-determining protein MreC